MVQTPYERKKVLITVKAYPQPSRSYDELVCTAGILEDGSWIRIYPVPFKFICFWEPPFNGIAEEAQILL